jgi:hypothetical protein
MDDNAASGALRCLAKATYVVNWKLTHETERAQVKEIPLHVCAMPPAVRLAACVAARSLA